MASAVQSFGSTTAVQIEDDASSELQVRQQNYGLICFGWTMSLRTLCCHSSQIQEGFDEHDGDGYETPNGQCDMPYCVSIMYFLISEIILCTYL